VVVHAGGDVKQYSVRKQDADDSDAPVSCNGSSSEVIRPTATAMDDSDELSEKR